MRIAIDFDGTFTAAPDFWREVIALAKSRGHAVVCVSCRQQTEENFRDIDAAMAPCLVPIYLTGGSPKRWYLEQRGEQVDVWVDDNMATVTQGR